MPKRRYINAKALLERIYGQRRRITTRQAELLDEWLRLEEAKVLLEDRAEVLVAYDWQSRHHFPLLAEAVTDA